MVRQATLIWAGAGGVSGQTALFFQDGATGFDIEDAIAEFELAIRPALANTTTVTDTGVIRDMSTASGVLTGEVALTSSPVTTGSGGASAVPNASQGLIRIATGIFLNGRHLRGRIYVPGMSASTVLGTGEVNTTGLNALAAAGTALVTSGVYGVWHRPVGGAGGVIHPANATSAWAEFAVQRRRRG